MAERAREIQELLWWRHAPAGGDAATEKWENPPILPLSLLSVGLLRNSDAPSAQAEYADLPANLLEAQTTLEALLAARQPDQPKWD